ncbi:MAG: TolC family protein [Trueperaceae bacterium]
MTPAPRRRPPPRAPALYVLVLIALTVGHGFAQSDPVALDLDAVLAAREGRVAVVTADLDLQEAERTLARTDADPLALRLERTQARQGVELARAELAMARADTAVELVGAWTRVRETMAQLALAEGARDLTGRALGVAQLRFERGSATRLDVDEAETDLADAEANVAAARDGLALARADLVGVVGRDVPVDATPIDRARLDLPLPDDATLDAAIVGLPAYLQVAHGAELASIAVDLLDPSFAAQAQIDQARTQLTQAEAGLTEVDRGLGLRARALRNAVASAADRDRIAREALGQAEERLAIEERRLEAGLVADLAVARVRLSVDQAGLAVLQAEHGLLRAWLELEAGTLLDLGVGRGF